MGRQTFVPSENFPQRLERFIAERGLTYKQVCKEVGLSQETLRRWRKGLVYPERRSFYRLCHQYGLSASQLLRVAGEEPLVLPTQGAVKVNNFLPHLDHIREHIPNLNIRQLRYLLRHLNVALREIREAQNRLCSIESTTTQTEKESSPSRRSRRSRAVPVRNIPL